MELYDLGNSTVNIDPKETGKDYNLAAVTSHEYLNEEQIENLKNIKLLNGVTHGKLMNDRQFLTYLYAELAREPVLDQGPNRTAQSVPIPLASGATPP